MRGQRHQPMKWVFIAFVILVLNSGYLAAFAEPTLFYMLNVLLHVVLGVALVIPFFIFVRRFLENDAPKGKELAIYMGRLGYWCLAPCVLAGLYLTVVNATHSHRWILYFHIAAGFIGVAFFQKAIRSVAHKVSTQNQYDVAGRVAWIVVVIAVFVPIAAGIYNMIVPRDDEQITNPMTQLRKLEEWTGNPFAPSAASTSTRKNISSESFLNSASCSRCHPNVYQQWQSSAHHYSSFNNPWYRKSVATLLAADTNFAAKNHPAKWCAGCHDPALLASGKFEQPVQELIKAPEAHAGISCTACHSIVRVESTMGQGHYVIEEMPLNDWAASDNKMLRELYDFLLRLDPEPHRQSMMKPFHRTESAEFCSACHKAHLDQPLNQLGWIRSFNDYDPWQAGPFSGRSSRGFYFGREGKSCVDCHMPLVESNDAGNVRGKIHSHRFLGANTALPVVNKDETQLRATTEFLRDNQITVDIFALAPAQQTMISEIDSSVIAPINQSNATVSRGDEARIEVVVRSRNVGHFFPSSKIDAHEVWLELQAIDDRGQIIFWSGAVADEGKGAVDFSAHFYRSYLADSNDPMTVNTHINLIPPGGADVARYRLKIPFECGDKIHLVAKLNYRKFSPAFTKWAFNDFFKTDAFGIAALGQAPQNGSAAALPEIPIVEMARDEATLAVVASGAENFRQAQVDNKIDSLDSERWNDYGLGLFEQGDLKNADAVFLRITQNVPHHAEAWINLGMIRLQEGNPESAKPAFETALKINAVPFKVYFYYAVTLKAQGKYDEALKYFKKILNKFPRDRVARNERGHLYLLMKDHQRAILDFEKVVSIDPENPEAYYHLQQAYRSAGEGEKAGQAARLYERFKARGALFNPK